MSKYVDFMNTPDGVQRIFTYEKVIKMPKLKLKKDLWRIYEQLDSIGIPDKKSWDCSITAKFLYGAQWMTTKFALSANPEIGKSFIIYKT